MSDAVLHCRDTDIDANIQAGGGANVYAGMDADVATGGDADIDADVDAGGVAG